MSITYPNYSYSVYPDEIDQFNRFTDLTLDTLEYAKEYNAYMTKGDLSSAAQVLINHPELETSLINAANLNRIIDAIKCIETFYAEDIQKYLIEIIKYKGEFSPSQKYSKYDLTMYNSLGYLCISSDCPLGTLPTDTEYFYAVTLQGETGEPGLGLSFLGVWDANTTYPKDSAVVYNNSLYASVANDNLAHTPSNTSSHWILVIDFNTITNYDNSSSNLSSTTLQGAIDELNDTLQDEIEEINTTIDEMNTTFQNEIDEMNVNITNNRTDIDANMNYIGYVHGLVDRIDNTPDSEKEVKYADGAGNADTVDGFHITASTTDLTANSSSLATNTLYFVYQ